MRPDPSSLVETLQAAAKGNADAAADLLPQVYDELRRLAQSKLERERPGQTLQPTALVHEAFLRLVGTSDPGWDGRRHFFASAAHAMRQILVEQARRKSAKKRPPREQRREVEGLDIEFEMPLGDVVDVDIALQALEREQPRKAQIVQLRYFAGLTTEEVAAILDVSIGTVERDWRSARAWLQRRLREE